jgi:hypothetical protein
MITDRKSSASASIISAAVVAIIGSALAIIFLSIGLFSFALMGFRQNPVLPAPLKIGMEVMMALFIGVAIFGVVTGIGLIRLRNWARISAMSWAGISICIAAFSVASILAMPFPSPPNAPAGMVGVVRWSVIGFYCIPMLTTFGG